MAVLNYGGGRGVSPPTAPEPREPYVRRRQDRPQCPDARILPRFGARGGAVGRSGMKSLRLKICRDVSGTWSVHGLSPLPVAHLPSLSASFDYARRECAAAPATIELVIDGFYAVVHQKDGWPRPPIVLKAKRSLGEDRGTMGSGHHDIGSVARSRSSWFSEWRACAMRLIDTLVSGGAAMKRSRPFLRHELRSPNQASNAKCCYAIGAHFVAVRASCKEFGLTQVRSNADVQ
jgi:hypothetical protein